MVEPRPPRLLTIAGSDSGGGAGIQADLKTFAAFGTYGMSVVTAVTAQNTVGVEAIHEIPPQVVRAQIDAVLDDIGVDAIKIGMLGSERVAVAVAEALEARAPCALVLDPVMVAKSGDSLLSSGAIEVVVERLLSRATVVTPNLPEVERLTSMPVGSERERLHAARHLADRGAATVLITGGHANGHEVVEDLFWDGQRCHRFVHPRLKTRSGHGTGCTLSSAIAAALGWGRSLQEAVGQACDYVHQALARAYPLGSGQGPVNHLYRFRGH